jgi:hypothetical protein
MVNLPGALPLPPLGSARGSRLATPTESSGRDRRSPFLRSGRPEGGGAGVASPRPAARHVHRFDEGSVLEPESVLDASIAGSLATDDRGKPDRQLPFESIADAARHFVNLGERARAPAMDRVEDLSPAEGRQGPALRERLPLAAGESEGFQ